jgi:hypothetical protein
VTRPTDLIRRLLIAESLQDSMTREITLIKEQMLSEGLKIIDRKNNAQDVLIQFLNGNQHDEAIFMRKMLDAESKGRAKRTGMMT